MKMHFNKMVALCCSLLLTLMVWPWQDANAQVSIINDFETGTSVPSGWGNVGGWVSSTSLPCSGTRSLRDNLWVSSTTGELTLPSWVSNGEDIDVSFDYKIINFSSPNGPPTGNWGEYKFEYSVDGGATWIAALTIDASNHVPSTACVNQSFSIAGSAVPNGTSVTARFKGNWFSGDFYTYLDNLSVLQEATSPPNCDSDLLIPGDGAFVVATDLTLSWSAATGAPTSYNLNVTNIDSATVAFDGNVGPALSQELTGLTPGNYEVQIVPENGVGLAGSCSTFSFTIGAALAGGDDCTAPAVISSLPITISDNTANFSNAYTNVDRPALPATFASISSGTGSGTYLTGNEAVYEYTASANGCLNVGVTVPATPTTNWTGLFVFRNCPFDEVLAFRTGTTASFNRNIENLPIAAGDTYYIVVSTWQSNTATSPFTLSISECAFDCPDFFGNIGDACDDGNPNTFDDVIDENCDCNGTAITGNMICSGAQNIQCGSVVTGTTVGSFPNEVPTCVTFNTLSGGRWFRYFTPTPQDVTMSLCNSDFNTRIRVFEGTCDSLVCVTGNDNNTTECGTGSLNAAVTFTAAPLTLYYVIVYGSTSTQEGNFELAVACSGFDCPSLALNEGDFCNVTGGGVGAVDANCDCVALDPPFEGCTDNTTSFGTHTTDCDASFAQSTNSWVNEFTTVNNILNGATYTFEALERSAAAPNIFITITSADSVVLGTGVNSVTVVATENTDGWRFYSDGILSCADTITGSATAHTRRTSWDCSTAIFDCQALGANFGDACDDGDENTINDVVTASCTCEGIVPLIGSCDDPEVVTSLPFNTSGNTAEYLNIYGSADVPPGGETFPSPISNGTGSSTYLTGPEAVYEWTAPDNGLFNAELTLTELGQWASLWIFGGCPFTEEFAFSTATTGLERNILLMPVVQGQTYYIVVSSWQSQTASIEYTLDLSFSTFDCPAIEANIGDACNDSLATTFNDSITPGCECAGIPFDCPTLLAQIGDACNDSLDTTFDDVITENCECAGTPFDCPDLLANIGDPCVLPPVGLSPFLIELDSVLTLGSPITYQDSVTFEVPAGADGLYDLTVTVNGVAQNGNWVSEFRVRITSADSVNITNGAPGGSADEWQPAIGSASGPINGTFTFDSVTVTAGTWILETRFSFDEGATVNGINDFDFQFDPLGELSTVGPDCQCTPLEPVCEANGGTLVYEGSNQFCSGTGTGSANFADVSVVGASGTFQRWGLFDSSGNLVANRGGDSQFNLTTFAPGTYTIRYLRYEADVDITTITSLASFANLEGCWDASSNNITVVVRPTPNGGTLTALSSTTICQGAGSSLQVGLSGFSGDIRRYGVATAGTFEVLLTQAGSPTGATFNLSSLPAGAYRAAAVAVQTGTSLAGVQFVSDLEGCFDLSNIVPFNIVNCAAATLASSPNPTGGQSFVSFTNPREEYATLEVYDMSGRMIEQLFNQVTNPGQEYRLEFDGNGLPNGVYLYRLTTASEVIVDKFMIAR